MAFVSGFRSMAAAASPISPPATTLNEALLQDCTASALGYFGSVRIPSALIAGSTLGTMFAIAQRPATNRLEKVVHRMYHVTTIVSFVLALTSVVTTTTASTSLLLGKYNPMAIDVYHFLKRELNFEFVLTRWSFLTSIFSFLAAVGVRILIEFELLDAKKRLRGSAAALLLVSVVSFLASHVNASLHCWPGLLGMTVEVAQLVKQKVQAKAPLAVLSAFLFCSALALATAELIAKEDKHQTMK